MSKIDSAYAPAFPLPNWDTTLWPQGTPGDFGTGLTKHEWLAGQALAGFCANPAVFAANDMNGWALVNCTEAQLAGQCNRLADALLAALRLTPSSPEPREKL